MTNMFTSETNDVLTVEAIKAKYGEDPDKAWEALLHSQKHISTLEHEAKERAKGVTLEQVLEQLKSSATPQSTPQTSGTPQSVLDDAALEQKLETMLKQRAEQERIANAKALVQSTMLAQFQTVDKAKEVMQTKSKELGMSVEALDTIALNSPQAFFQLIGIDAGQRHTNAAPTLGSIRTGLNNDAKPQNPVESYREMIKTDRNKFNTDEVQTEIMRKAFKEAGLIK